jgi:hypothetical protein
MMKGPGMKQEKPPLGSIEDLARAEAEKRLSFEYDSPEAYPEVAEALKSLGFEINNLRNESGTSPLEFSSLDIRLIKSDLWPEVIKDADLRETEVFWDPVTEKIYILHYPERYGESKNERMVTII